jgi:outer membrane protein
MRREFGVTQAEAARRQALIDAGDDRLEADEGVAYRPHGGLRHIRASLSLGYPLSTRWSVIGFGVLDRLIGQAAGSPLVRDKEQFAGALGVAYGL